MDDPRDQQPHPLRGSTPAEETALVTQLGVYQREKLRANSHKVHWRMQGERSVEVVVDRFINNLLRDELGELKGAVRRAEHERWDPDCPVCEHSLSLDDLVKAVWREAADVANFAAMIADLVEKGRMEVDES